MHTASTSRLRWSEDVFRNWSVPLLNKEHTPAPILARLSAENRSTVSKFNLKKVGDCKAHPTQFHVTGTLASECWLAQAGISLHQWYPYHINLSLLIAVQLEHCIEKHSVATAKTTAEMMLSSNPHCTRQIVMRYVYHDLLCKVREI